jgi:ABC-type multidrug transport system ATPase subunit
VSGGQQQLLFIALTLLQLKKKKISICIFDELDAGLDPETRIRVLSYLTAYLKKLKVTVIWITHMSDQELQESGIIFDGGRLLFQKSKNGCNIVVTPQL